MNLLAHLLSPETMRIVALTLLHFLWQGAALAALAYVGMSLCRSASARYAFSVAILVSMLAAPVATFLVLNAQVQAGPPANSNAPALALPSFASTQLAAMAKKSPAPYWNAPDYLFLLVELWFAGVVLFSLRSAGGFFLVAQLRRKECAPLPPELLELCHLLQGKMGLQRIVRYCATIHLEAPAVAGWLCPVVLLPITALTGLSEPQLQAVIAHELAHIRRLDAFLNLFQIAVESLLFYHPAVWWLGKRIREERENCCDDAAVAVCGSPVVYARALARMAESRVAPQLLMAANRGPLAARVSRLLGINSTTGALRVADLSAAVLCLSAALLAGTAFISVARSVHAQTPARLEAPVLAQATAPSRPPTPATKPEPDIIVRPADLVAVPTPAATPTPNAAASPAQVPQTSAQPAAQSYVDGLKSAGLNDLTVDQLISLKIQGVTPEYVKQLHDLGLHPDADELVGMKVQGITPEYVREIRAATGQSLGVDDLIGLKVQGVTPEYIKQLHDLGLKTDADDVIGMKVQGITPEYVREMRSLGLKVDSDELIGMKVQGINPEYVKSIQALGLHPDADELIGMKVQGVDANYLKEMQAAGFKLDVDSAIGAKVQGVTPEFIQKVRSHGFKDLTLNQLISLKQSGVLDSQK